MLNDLLDMTAKLLQPAVHSGSAAGAADLRLAPRSRLVRDFVLLITVCVSVGLSVGLGMMVAVLALL